MKTWEVIKALMESPSLTFKNLRFGGVIGYNAQGVLAWIKNSDNVGKAFTIHYSPDNITTSGNWNDDWELLRQPVDFLVATKSGKDIRPEGYGGAYYSLAYWLNGRLDASMICGKWYIE